MSVGDSKQSITDIAINAAWHTQQLQFLSPYQSKSESIKYSFAIDILSRDDCTFGNYCQSFPRLAVRLTP